MVREHRVVIGAVQRVGVHAGRRQPGDGVDQRVFGADRDVVRLDHGTGRVHRDLAFGADGAADPAQPDPADGQHARGGAQGGLGLLGQRGIHAVHQPPAAVISRPTTGSAQRQPIATPPAPASTASEVNPSVRACRPSATSAAEPIRRPVLIR